MQNFRIRSYFLVLCLASTLSFLMSCKGNSPSGPSDSTDGDTTVTTPTDSTDGDTTVTTPTDSTDGDTAVSAPSSPSDLTAKAGDKGAILTWPSVATATSYTLYRSTDSTNITGGDTLANVSSPYSDTGLIPNEDYYYQVSASNEGGESSLSNSVVAIPTYPGMVVIPKGCFQMGTSSGGDSDERPVHQVCLDRFLMDTVEVTQAAYNSVIGSNPSNFTGNTSRPVETVNWTEASAYCDSLGGSLPTESEWEYAARAGTTTDYYWGTESAEDYAWLSTNSGSTTHPVGTKKPNAWGLYDMSGNVWEWVSDWHDTYPSEAQTNPTGPSTGTNRVSRGGSYYNSAAGVRSASRISVTPSYRNILLGFRCVFR